METYGILQEVDWIHNLNEYKAVMLQFSDILVGYDKQSSKIMSEGLTAQAKQAV